MSQAGSDAHETAASADADEVIARSVEDLLDLGMPGDSTLATMIRPLARALLLQVDPQDAAERMLAVQMIGSFSRSMFLSRNANRQKNSRWFALYSGECNRAMALFRRQMQTFIDLRRPRRTSFTAIRHANIAGQQIVVTDSPTSDRSSQPKLQSPTRRTLATGEFANAKPLQKTPPALPPQQCRPRGIVRKPPKKPPLGT